MHSTARTAHQFRLNRPDGYLASRHRYPILTIGRLSAIGSSISICSTTRGQVCASLGRLRYVAIPLTNFVSFGPKFFIILDLSTAVLIDLNRYLHSPEYRVVVG